jgi:histone H3/H4
MPKQKKSVTKLYTLGQFMKTVTKLKISEDTIEDLIRTLDELVTKITRLSEKIATAQKRKTIMPHDLEQALDEILRRGPLTVDELLEKIEPLSVIELSQLAKKIKQKADELLKPKKTKRVASRKARHISQPRK